MKTISDEIVEVVINKLKNILGDEGSESVLNNFEKNGNHKSVIAEKPKLLSDFLKELFGEGSRDLIEKEISNELAIHFNTAYDKNKSLNENILFLRNWTTRGNNL